MRDTRPVSQLPQDALRILLGHGAISALRSLVLQHGGTAGSSAESCLCVAACIRCTLSSLPAASRLLHSSDRATLSLEGAASQQLLAVERLLAAGQQQNVSSWSSTALADYPASFPSLLSAALSLAALLFSRDLSEAMRGLRKEATHHLTVVQPRFPELHRLAVGAHGLGPSLEPSSEGRASYSLPSLGHDGPEEEQTLGEASLQLLALEWGAGACGFGPAVDATGPDRCWSVEEGVAVMTRLAFESREGSSLKHTALSCLWPLLILLGRSTPPAQLPPDQLSALLMVLQNASSCDSLSCRPPALAGLSLLTAMYPSLTSKPWNRPVLEAVVCRLCEEESLPSAGCMGWGEDGRGVEHGGGGSMAEGGDELASPLPWPHLLLLRALLQGMDQTPACLWLRTDMVAALSSRCLLPALLSGAVWPASDSRLESKAAAALCRGICHELVTSSFIGDVASPRIRSAMQAAFDPQLASPSDPTEAQQPLSLEDCCLLPRDAPLLMLAAGIIANEGRQAQGGGIQALLTGCTADDVLKALNDREKEG